MNTGRAAPAASTARRPDPRGATLVELATVVAIIAILASAAVASFARERPRADLASAAVELQALLHQARQSALASGTPVSVLFYPGFSPPSSGGGSKGYAVVYQDACFDFFTGGGTCGVAYASYDPATLPVGGNGTLQSAVLDTLALPRGVIVGPPTGMGAAAALPAPLDTVVVNVACSFCGATGGAVQFDPRGQASFYSLSGGTVTGPLDASTAPSVNGGASISLGFDPTVAPVTAERTLVIFSASGAVQAFTGG